MQAPSENQNQQAQQPTQQHSMIGKTIVIKGEITAADPIYIYGTIEGSVSAPAHRVTVGRDGNVKANISAREVIVMGDVRGKLEGSYRVEIRADGSHTGELTAHRVCVEEGAVLKGTIDIHKAPEPAKTDVKEKQTPKVEVAEEATSAA